MKTITRQQTKEFKNGNTCIAVEYLFGDNDINIAVIKLTGRYPEKGFAVNEKCKEIGFVMEGKGIVVIGNKVVSLEKGDAVLIQPYEKFYWDGVMTLIMPCTPAWTPQQYKYIE